MHRILPTAVLVLCAACRSAPLSREQCERVLAEQAEQWNGGDLPAFVATYWDGPELTFLGASGLVRGRNDLLASYQRAYPTAEARGRLSFEVVEFQPLGGDHALLLGRYALARGTPDAGWFSLVLRRTPAGVRILHDHTSRAAR
jgi:hypothetical protein